MKIVIAPAVKTMASLWEDIKFGEAAQSVNDPENIVLKISSETGMRLKATSMGSTGTAQHPGPASKWYVCESELTVTPVMGI